MRTRALPNDPVPTALILSGGLALGAYQAGALRILLESGRFDIRAVAGSSIGAIHAALLAGTASSDRLQVLASFWDAVAVDSLTSSSVFELVDTGRARHAANWASAAAGRLGVPNLFRLRWPGEREPDRSSPSLYVAEPLEGLLARLIDVDRLSAGDVRLCVAACDIEAGEPVLFDTTAGDSIALEHVLASGALMPAFSPVELHGRLLGDGGFALNAPLEPLLASDRQASDWPLAILIDLFSPDEPPPRSLEHSIARSTDLQFAMQTKIRLAGLVRERSLEARLEPHTPGTDLFHLSYRPLPHEAGSEKTYDFSRATLRDRMEAGAADAARLLALLADVDLTGEAGLRVHRVRADQSLADAVKIAPAGPARSR